MTQTFVAEPGRLDAVVAKRLGVPRADVQRAIAAGRVHVDGEVREKSFRLAGGELVELEARDQEALQPDPAPLDVMFEDAHLLVVSKPAGVLTHPTASIRAGTLVNRLLGRGVKLSSGTDPDRPGIVHRLDVGTSGALVVAKDDETHAALSAMFRRHEVDRKYLALVRGVVRHDDFLIDAPLGRERAHIRIRAVTGRAAATEVTARERFAHSTLLEARPRTGRTHQIRVHLSSIGHPILGDRTYGGAGPDAVRLGLKRPFLHSWQIRFLHPMTEESVECTAPLPEDLQEAIEVARKE
ncbi:MAG TPA: RluA family pseudouridine synthase [Actinomycetota bacterium]